MRAELDGSNEACGCFVCCLVGFVVLLVFAWFVLLAPAAESWPGGFHCKLPRGGDCWLVLWPLPVLWPCIALLISGHFLR